MVSVDGDEWTKKDHQDGENFVVDFALFVGLCLRSRVSWN